MRPREQIYREVVFSRGNFEALRLGRGFLAMMVSLMWPHGALSPASLALIFSQSRLPRFCSALFLGAWQSWRGRCVGAGIGRRGRSLVRSHRSPWAQAMVREFLGQLMDATRPTRSFSCSGEVDFFTIQGMPGLRRIPPGVKADAEKHFGVIDFVGVRVSQPLP